MQPQYSLADTDVYVTNSTAQPLSITINHTGSEWLQQAEQIGPYETKMVLSMNRWTGVKSGKKYRFETVLTNESGDSVTLHQKMNGHWYNSSITYGVSTDDVALSLKDDSEIHRYISSFGSENSADAKAELAFRSTATARYDDLYYAITPENLQEQPESDPHSLKVMTYNIWALPAIASHIADRFYILPEYVKGYDALLLQEVFDGGVVIVSRYPIVNEAQFVYPDCSGTDCFADKGVNYAEVIKNGRAYHLFATHTASFDTDTARDYRQRQFRQIRDLAASLKIPSNETVVYGGDFNVNKRKYQTATENTNTVQGAQNLDNLAQGSQGSVRSLSG